MMIMMFFFSFLVLIMGRIGIRARRVQKAAVAHRLFKKSVILLIPFVLVVISLKGQGKRMKEIMEYVKNEDNSTLSNSTLSFDSSDVASLPQFDIDQETEDDDKDNQRGHHGGHHGNHHNHDGGRLLRGGHHDGHHNR